MRSQPIGLITHDTKRLGRPGAGTRHAGLEAAGAGDGPQGTAPVLDPTQDRQGPRPDDPAVGTGAGRSGDRVMANRHPRLVTFRGLLGQSTTIQNSSSLRIGCGTRQAGHIAVSVSVSTTGSSKLICLLRYPLSALVGALTAIQH